MKKKSPSAFVTLIRAIVALALLLPTLVVAQDNKVDVQSIVHETQQTIHQDHKMTMVWWVPEQFWLASFAANPRLTPEQIAGFTKTLRPYTLLVVVKGEFGPMGGLTYANAASIRTNLTLIDSTGNSYSPLDDADVSADMQNFLAIMKPVFANMLGSMGKNLDFFAFPANGKNGRLIADAQAEGRFSVQVGADKFKWRLPLGSLLPPKTCSKCGEKLSGAYKFCPYDGTPLEK